MRRIALILGALLLIGSNIACCIMPRLPEIEINVPTVQVGEMRDEREEIPLSGVESATVELFFGAGELEIAAGDPDLLLSGHFRYNIEQWEPRIDFQNGVLTIKQGDSDDWGISTGNAHNEWELGFSPDIPLDMDVKVGAGKGRMDLTGLQLTTLELDLGAGDFDVRFDEPNQARLERFALNTGASKLQVRGIGNAGPERITVQGGVGDISLDFTGDWVRSAEVDITAGIGALTLRLPDDVGVEIQVDGLANVETSGLRRSGDVYVNDAFGKAEVELHIQIATGLGAVKLIQVSND